MESQLECTGILDYLLVRMQILPLQETIYQDALLAELANAHLCSISSFRTVISQSAAILILEETTPKRLRSALFKSASSGKTRQAPPPPPSPPTHQHENLSIATFGTRIQLPSHLGQEVQGIGTPKVLTAVAKKEAELKMRCHGLEAESL